MYGKIFDSIYDGTLYGQWEAMITFQQLIILADADGTVDITPPALAARTGIPLDIITKGLEILEAPDPYSRTEGEEGRRITRLDDHRPWGWSIVNHSKYKGLQDSDTIRASNRARKQRQRERQKSVTDGHAKSQTVTDGHSQSLHTDTDKEDYMSGKPDCVEVLEHLNSKARRGYLPVASNLKLIRARLKEYGKETLLEVVDSKVAAWANDEKLSEYLRPATLFNAEKCAQYVGQINNKPKAKGFV